MPKPTAGANPSPRSTAAAAGSAAAGMRRSQSTYGRCSPGSYSRSAIAGPLRRIASTPAAASAPMTSADMRSTARLIAVSSMAAGSPRRPGMRRSVEQACDDHAHTIAAMPAGGSILNARVHWWLHHLSDIGANIGVTTIELLSRLPGATSVAFEPEPANLDLLAHNVLANGLQDRVTTHGLA